MDIMNVKDVPKVFDTKNEFREWNAQSTMFVKFDIKNQFTNLDKPSVIKAVIFAIKELKKFKKVEHIAIRKRIAEKKNDHIGKGYKRDYHNIELDTIYRYVVFELETSYFTVGTELYIQKNGLPMGGYLSAGLAVLYSMYCEHHNQKLWRNLSFKSLWIRYRDDVLGIIEKRLSTTEMEMLRSQFERMYGKSLQVELEDTQLQETFFLEFWIWIQDKKITYCNYSKNWDGSSIVDVHKRVVRLPELNTETPDVILKGITTGFIKKAMKYTNTPIGKLIGTFQAVFELRNMGYRKKWIADAIMRTQDDLAIDVRRFCLHRYAEKFVGMTHNAFLQIGSPGDLSGVTIIVT